MASSDALGSLGWSNVGWPLPLSQNGPKQSRPGLHVGFIDVYPKNADSVFAGWFLYVSTRNRTVSENLKPPNLWDKTPLPNRFLSIPPSSSAKKHHLSWWLIFYVGITKNDGSPSSMTILWKMISPQVLRDISRLRKSSCSSLAEPIQGTSRSKNWGIHLLNMETIPDFFTSDISTIQ